MRTVLAVSTVSAALLVGALAAGPASAASSTETVAFTVVGGTLAITPGTAAAGVGTVLVGATTSATIDLGLTTVADTRVNSTGWAVSAASGDFSGTPAPGTIGRTNAKFSVPLAPLSVLGSPAVTFTTVSSPTAVDATGTLANLVVATASGVNTGTFTPQLNVTIPNGSATGAYIGVITQTVV